MSPRVPQDTTSGASASVFIAADTARDDDAAERNRSNDTENFQKTSAEKGIKAESNTEKARKAKESNKIRTSNQRKTKQGAQRYFERKKR